jgi:ATP/maltotriose-dependent transcriptional regulator MalT
MTTTDSRFRQSVSLNAFKYWPAIVHPLALERTYLRNFFSGAFDVPLVILEAESGYGKTTTLSSVAGREGYSSRWLTLDDSDRDLNCFIHDLLKSIYGRNIPEEVSPLSVRRGLDLILGAVNELAVSSIILDNFDSVARVEPITTLLEQLIDELPPFTRLIISTKRPPNLRRGSRRSRSAVLTQPDLRFDVDDVSQYFLKMHNYQLTPNEAAFIAERTGGRPVLINLLGQLTRNLPSYLKVDWRQLPLGSEDESIKLLLREVISKLPRSLARVAREIGPAEGMASDGHSPVCDLLDTLAERHCLVQRYHQEGDSTVLNVPHEILVGLSPIL